MKNKKLLSLILALVMMVGVFSPLTALAAGEDEGEKPTANTVKKEDMVGTISSNDVQKAKPDNTTLTIHKLVADSYNGGVPVDHNGGSLTNEQLGKLGTNVKGLSGVKFTIYKIEKEDDFKTIKEASPKTVEAMKTYVDGGKATLATATGLTNGETNATGSDGSVTVNLPDGNYWVVESERPSRVTSSLAVPFGITLPLLNQVKVGDNEAGTMYMKNVHVYPKNTEKKPEMDKYFGEPVEGTESKKLTKNHEMHPDYQKYLEKKKTIDARVGSKVPYEVKTSLKAGQTYKTLSWSDIMTTGLKYNKDLTITYKANGAAEETTVTITAPSTITDSDYGFDVVIKDEATIKAINEALAKGDVEFTLKYTATLTNDAVVDLPESNNITFTPGEPKHKNDQEPVNPKEGKLKVTKTWAEGKAPEGVLVTYILFEGTNPIASVTLKGTEIQSSSLPEGVKAEVEAGTYNVTFSGLDNNKTYKIEEFANGYDPEYTSANGVKNKVNPDTITPTPPQVETYGKKFVKTDATTEKNRLAGAEFVVKNGTGEGAKYLVAKTGDQIAKEQQAVKDAKKALDTAVETYNNLEKAQQTDDERAKVTAAQEDYNKAVKAAGNVYEWGDKAKAITLVSDGQGRFEITGLVEGTYYLEETKAPEGFAKLTSDVPFTVNNKSYTTGGEKAIDYVPSSNKNDAQQVENKNLTIPQTGGKGTILFTIVGIGLMAGAIVAMKKNKEEA
ncbi:MAG: isopeptide-forming domain-containing fimbrial protein [Peptoniphilus harei]|uniref:pilin N-terminal domain-containing protein n=1 Tax=Peptoniphilus rhinitidis TaxID=1175452 RepID=UPI002910CE73|nr:pilin N-terminal domain-containing protein [Peptoniphilus rhinitidis]MBS6610452.1 isopeptide-forming domain-containing fimbrial protein [Peptoniphilus harei]MDU5594515.1 pilin N-terminal domain-containing protein [Peptoniphilus rhinitidis]